MTRNAFTARTRRTRQPARPPWCPAPRGRVDSRGIGQPEGRRHGREGELTASAASRGRPRVAAGRSREAMGHPAWGAVSATWKVSSHSNFWHLLYSFFLLLQYSPLVAPSFIYRGPFFNGSCCEVCDILTLLLFILGTGADASVTQSALEEALLSKMQDGAGGSRFSISTAFRSRHAGAAATSSVKPGQQPAGQRVPIGQHNTRYAGEGT